MSSATIPKSNTNHNASGIIATASIDDYSQRYKRGEPVTLQGCIDAREFGHCYLSCVRGNKSAYDSLTEMSMTIFISSPLDISFKVSE